MIIDKDLVTLNADRSFLDKAPFNPSTLVKIVQAELCPQRKHQYNAPITAEHQVSESYGTIILKIVDACMYQRICVHKPFDFAV